MLQALRLAVVAAVLVCVVPCAAPAPTGGSAVFRARPPPAAVPTLSPMRATSAVDAGGRTHGAPAGGAPYVGEGDVSVAHMHVAAGQGSRAGGGAGTGSSADSSVTGSTGSQGSTGNSSDRSDTAAVGAASRSGAYDSGGGDGVALAAAATATGTDSVLHVRQSFVFDGAKYAVLVPEGEPMNDVRPRTLLACAEVGLPEAHCEQVTASLQDKYNVMMGLTHGHTREGRAKTARKYTDPDYWSAICPQLHVNSRWAPDAWNSTVASTPDELRAIDGYMRRNGYFKVDGGDWALPVDHSVLADCVVALRQHGWPGVFGYMFDEFWMLTRRLHGIVRHVLGDDALVMPDIWVFNIDPRDGEPAGWAPHRDRPLNTPLMADGSASSINFWLPLTDATPLNGCMYILPRPADPLMPTDNGLENDPRRDNVERQQLQYVRALPSKPGDVLGWDGWVLHWGSAATSDPPQPARISIAAEFQRNPATNAGLQPMNNPLMGMQFNPTTVTRLSLACKQVNNYRHIREALQPWVDRLCGDIDSVLAAAGLPVLPQAPGTVLGTSA